MADEPDRARPAFAHPVGDRLELRDVADESSERLRLLADLRQQLSAHDGHLGERPSRGWNTGAELVRSRRLSSVTSL